MEVCAKFENKFALRVLRIRHLHEWDRKTEGHMDRQTDRWIDGQIT